MKYGAFFSTEILVQSIYSNAIFLDNLSLLWKYNIRLKSIVRHLTDRQTARRMERQTDGQILFAKVKKVFFSDTWSEHCLDKSHVFNFKLSCQFFQPISSFGLPPSSLAGCEDLLSSMFVKNNGDVKCFLRFTSKF